MVNASPAGRGATPWGPHSSWSCVPVALRACAVDHASKSTGQSTCTLLNNASTTTVRVAMARKGGQRVSWSGTSAPSDSTNKNSAAVPPPVRGGGCDRWRHARKVGVSWRTSCLVSHAFAVSMTPALEISTCERRKISLRVGSRVARFVRRLPLVHRLRGEGLTPAVRIVTPAAISPADDSATDTPTHYTDGT